jgi:hypothetical protein
VAADSAPSEWVLWTGSPVRHPVLDAGDVGRLLLGTLGAALVLNITMRLVHGDVLGVVWFCAVAAFWLYVVVGQYVVRWLALRSTVYTVTDKRLVVESTVLGLKHQRSGYYQELGLPVVVDRGDGVGDVRFGEDRGWASRYRTGRQLELRAIEAPAAVRDLILAANGWRPGG